MVQANILNKTHTLSSNSGNFPSSTKAPDENIVVITGANAKNTFIFFANSGKVENARKPGGGRNMKDMNRS